MTTVTLSERGREIVQRQLESGTYEDAAAVVERALALLQNEDEAHWAAVRAKVAEGRADVASGRVRPWHEGSIDEIRALAEERRRASS